MSATFRGQPDIFERDTRALAHAPEDAIRFLEQSGGAVELLKGNERPKKAGAGKIHTAICPASSTHMRS